VKINKHVFAGDGAASSSNASGPQRAPDGQISVALGRKSITQKINMSAFKSSSKIEACISAVNAAPDEDKIIIFSQYRTMLDLVEFRLRQEGVEMCKLMGDMPLAERRSVLAAFQDPAKGIRVILLSLKAGGEGLNLQMANRVMLLEPWWNPAVELQAVQRAHRIGQKKPVTAVRFVTRDTIEHKMSVLQEKKQLAFDGVFDTGKVALGKLTAEDLNFLFKSS